jgi:Amidohydrolase family
MSRPVCLPFLLAVVFAGLPACKGAPVSGDYALRHVTVIDATGSPPSANMTVVVKGDRLVEVGRDVDVDLAPGTKAIDLTGTYVIPGLADMHAHNQPSVSPSVYVVNGVTTVREMSGAPFVLDWRQAIDAGTLLGPRLVIGSPMIDGAPSLWENVPAPVVSVADGPAARQAVRDAKGQGYDFVKVYSRLSRQAFLALADEARLQGIPIAGHCPDLVPLGEASAAGERSFEHLFDLLYATSAQEAELRPRVDAITLELGPFGGYASWFHQTNAIEWDAASSYSPQKAAALFAQLVRDGSAQVPTLATLKLVDLPTDVALEDPRLQYVPASLLAAWQYELSGIFLAGRSDEESAQRRQLFERRLALVGALRQAGVRVLAGTDNMTPWVIPGFSLHDELALLVRAGLTPLEALQAATVEPARFLGLQDTLGTVEKGKVADLVVLDADPLQAIENTTHIHAVVLRGRLIMPEERQGLLDQLAAAAKTL